MKWTRREMMIASALSGAAAAGLDPLLSAKADETAAAAKKPCRVGAWLGGLGAFETAKRNGLDVVQFGFPFHPGGENDFRNPDVCRRFREKSAETGVGITSLAMGEFNGNPFWEIDEAEPLVTEAIAAMVRLEVKTVLVAFFGKGTLTSDDRFDATIRRLKNLAPKAADAGVSLAIESTLDAAGHLRILDAVNSPAVTVYYDPGNMIHRFADTDQIVADILALSGRISEAHAKDSGLLGKGKIDYAKILDAYRKANYFGPQVLEGSVDPDLGADESQKRNAAYLRTL